MIAVLAYCTLMTLKLGNVWPIPESSVQGPFASNSTSMIVFFTSKTAHSIPAAFQGEFGEHTQPTRNPGIVLVNVLLMFSFVFIIFVG